MTTTSSMVAPPDREVLPACLYCGRRSYTPLYENLQDRLGYVSGRWTFWRCGECGSAVLSPFPRANELASFYPPVYSFRLDLGGGSAFRQLLANLEYRIF